MLCRICIVQIQTRNHVLVHVDYAAPTKKHELDHTDHTGHTDHQVIQIIQVIQIRNLYALKDL